MSVDASEQVTLNATVVLSPPDINAGAPVEARAWDLQPPTTNTADIGRFSLYMYDTLFSGTYDPTFSLGYNVSPGGGRVTATEPALGWQLETDYNNGSVHAAEYYLQYQPDNTVAAVPMKRPIFLAWRSDRYDQIDAVFRSNSWSFQRWDDNAECTANVTPHACCTGAGTGTCGSVWGSLSPTSLNLTGAVGQSTDTSMTATAVNSKKAYMQFTANAKSIQVGVDPTNGPEIRAHTGGGTSFYGTAGVVAQDGQFSNTTTWPGTPDSWGSFTDTNTITNATGTGGDNGRVHASLRSAYIVTGGDRTSVIEGLRFQTTDAGTLANTHRGYRCYLGGLTNANANSVCLQLDAQDGVGGTHSLGTMANGKLSMTAAPFEWDTTPATAGNLRHPNNTDALCWRNAANSANLCLKTDASNNLLFNGSGISGDITDVGDCTGVSGACFTSAAGAGTTLTFHNATSGTIAVTPVTGALGAVTLSLPAATDTLVGKSTTDDLANKNLQDSTTTFFDNATPTKKFALQLSGISASTTRTLTPPDYDGVIATTGGVEDFTNKTLQDASTLLQDETIVSKRLAFQLSSIAPATTRTLTVPDANGTIVLKDTVDTLTNKTLSGGLATTTHEAGANFIRTMQHATDCTAITDGKLGELCYEQDANATYICEPDAGDCSGTEWKAVGSAGAGDITDVGSCVGPACFTSGAPSADLTFNNATSGTVTLKTVTGALGTVTASLPAKTGTLAMTSDLPERNPTLLDGALCDGVTDDLAAFQAANTALASTGGTIVVPGNKTCMLSGLTTLNSDVSVRCASGGALAVSTKTCSGGTYPGASCTVSGDCSGGGTCVGTAFAPTAATTYTLFASASNSESNGLTNCIIYGGGIDGYQTCNGGTRDNLPCKNTCAAGTNSGFVCTTYTQCPFGGGTCTGGPDVQGTCAAGELCSASSGGTCFKTCTMDTNCSGGACTDIPGYPSGANNTSGSIVIANFRNARTGSVITNNTLYDVRKNGMLAIGAYGQATGNTWGATRTTYSGNTYVAPPAFAAPPLNATMASQTDAAISTHTSGIVTGNNIKNFVSGVGISAFSSIQLYVAGNTVMGVGIVGNYGFAGSSGGVGRIANNLFGTLEVGIATVGTDVWIVNNTFSVTLVSVAGAGAGMHLENNNLLFSGGFSMPSGGPYTGPWSTSFAHATIKNNFCATAGNCNIWTPGQDKRCCAALNSCSTSVGTKQYQVCSVDTDCTDFGASGGTNICGYTYINDVDVTGNTAYLASIAFDLSPLGTVVSQTGLSTGGYRTNISNNTCTSGTTCFKFPDTGTSGKNARRCKGGANSRAGGGGSDAACAIASCAADCGAGATCPGDCVPMLTSLIFANNAIGNVVTTPVSQWHADYGLMSQNTWLNAGDPTAMSVFLTNKSGAAAKLYEAVTSDQATTNGVKQAAASSAQSILGVWVSEAANNAKGAVAVQGVTRCYVTAATVSLGDRLCMSATAGAGMPCPAYQDGYALALEANGSAAKSISCFVNGNAIAKESTNMRNFGWQRDLGVAGTSVGMAPTGTAIAPMLFTSSNTVPTLSASFAADRAYTTLTNAAISGDDAILVWPTYSGTAAVTAGIQRGWNPRMTSIIKTGATNTSERIWCGWFQETGSDVDQVSPPLHGMAFRYDTGTDTGTTCSGTVATCWRTWTNDGGADAGTVTTPSDAAALLTASTQYTLHADASSGTDVKFYVNGTLVSTHTTNLPTTTTNLGWLCGVSNLTTASRVLEVSAAQVSFP